MDDLKRRIKSILLLSPYGMDLAEFHRTFIDLSGYRLNPLDYGHSNVLSLLSSLSDVVRFEGRFLQGINTSDTARITSDIIRQNKPKRKGGGRSRGRGRRNYSQSFRQPSVSYYYDRQDYLFSESRYMEYSDDDGSSSLSSGTIELMTASSRRPSSYSTFATSSSAISTGAFNRPFTSSYSTFAPNSATSTSTSSNLRGGSRLRNYNPDSPRSWSVGSDGRSVTFSGDLKEKESNIPVTTNTATQSGSIWGGAVTTEGTEKRTVFYRGQECTTNPVSVIRHSEEKENVAPPSPAAPRVVAWPDPTPFLTRRRHSLPVSAASNIFATTTTTGSTTNAAQSSATVAASTNLETIVESDMSSACTLSVASVPNIEANIAATRSTVSRFSLSISSKTSRMKYLTVRDLYTTVDDALPYTLEGSIVGVMAEVIIFRTSSGVHETALLSLQSRMSTELVQGWQRMWRSEVWQPGALVVVRGVNGDEDHVDRAVLLDSFVVSGVVEDSNSLTDESAFLESREMRKCLVFLLDMGSVKHVTGDQIRFLHIDEHQWIVDVPPQCCIVTLPNVISYEEPRCIPLEPMRGALFYCIRGCMHLEAECRVVSTFQDGILPRVHVVERFYLVDEVMDLCMELPKLCANVKLTTRLHSNSMRAWHFKPQYALPHSGNLQVCLCQPLQWWLRSKIGKHHSDAVENELELQEDSSSGTIVMVMAQLRTPALRSDKLEAYLAALIERIGVQPVEEIVVGQVYLMYDEPTWVRVRVQKELEDKKLQVLLMDYHSKRIRTVDSSELKPYTTPPDFSMSAIPFFCRALPVHVQDNMELLDFLKSFQGKPVICAQRSGLAFNLL